MEKYDILELFAFEIVVSDHRSRNYAKWNRSGLITNQSVKVKSAPRNNFWIIRQVTQSFQRHFWSLLYVIAHTQV